MDKFQRIMNNMKNKKYNSKKIKIINKYIILIRM